MESENRYTSFDLMKIFGIKRGSWNNIKKKFNLDDYCEKIYDGKKLKFLYNEEAYNVLKEEYKTKIVKEVKENPKMMTLLKENEGLKATLDEYKNISSKFEKMYVDEKEAKEKVIEESHKKDIKITELEGDNKRIRDNWNASNLNNVELKKEIERLKSRSLWQRILNK